MSVIGVVSSAGKEPTRTTKGGTNYTLRAFWSLTIWASSDWCTCFSLLDPSVLDSFGGVLYTDGSGVKLNCFMRLEKWLPNPKQGDVVLLRHVKVPYVYHRLRQVSGLKTCLRLGSGRINLLALATRTRCNGRSTTPLPKKCCSQIPDSPAFGLITRPYGTLCRRR